MAVQIFIRPEFRRKLFLEGPRRGKPPINQARTAGVGLLAIVAGAYWVPLSKHPVLVATVGEVNAMVDLYIGKHGLRRHRDQRYVWLGH